MLARASQGGAPAKIRLGSWMLPAMRWLAHGKWLRGTAFDLFGYTEERRLERESITQFENRLDELATNLSATNQLLAARIAALPLTIRGYGHVKLANFLLAADREAELLHRFCPQRYPKPEKAPTAVHFQGISVVSH